MQFLLISHKTHISHIAYNSSKKENFISRVKKGFVATMDDFEVNNRILFLACFSVNFGRF